jgi:alpha-tubulin suppressor-like RCC1 family protein
LSCAPGSFNCQKGEPTLKQCNLDGTAWDVVRTCRSGAACFANGEVGYCELCTPGETVCEPTRREYATAVSMTGDHSRSGASLRVCNSQGSATELVEECGLDAPVCDAVAGKCRSCAPGQFTCEGGTVYLCNANGNGRELIEHCGHPALCDAAAGTCRRAGCARPGAPSAEVGTVACEKSALSICRASGKWEVLDICADDAACSAGVAVRRCLDLSTQCLPGTSTCAGTTLQYCAAFSDNSRSAAAGGAFYPYANCAAGCSEPTPGSADCEPAPTNESAYTNALVCQPGSSDYRSCADGVCVDAVCARDQVCADSRLGCRRCVPSALRCDGRQLLRCNAQGSAEDLVKHCGDGVCDKVRGQCLPAPVGERYCSDGELHSVSVDGSSRIIENCGAPELCDANSGCRPAHCVLGSLSCDSAEVLRCDDGTEKLTEVERCDSAARCEEGLGCAVSARVTAGDGHTCALFVAADAASDATGYVKCWGANESGQLGNGAQMLGDEPAARPVVSRLTGEPIQASPIFRRSGLCAGKNFSCADVSLPNGEPGVACWGANERGQLGIGGKLGPGAAAGATYNHIELPVMQAAEAASTLTESAFTGLHAVTCGADFACALDASARVHCWGANDAGQLGTGQTSLASSVAVPVVGVGAVTSLVAGARHACAVDANRRLRCWGDDSKDQLGQGATTVNQFPEAVSLPVRAALGLALGRDFTLALTASEVWAWGQNGFGQLTTGNTAAQLQPTVARGLDVGQTSLLVSGPTASHACAVINGSLWCWGANPLAELGDGSRLDRYQPVRVMLAESSQLRGLPGSVAAGKAHTCAIDDDGSIWCWGANQRGQLGPSLPPGTAAIPLQIY